MYIDTKKCTQEFSIILLGCFSERGGRRGGGGQLYKWMWFASWAKIL